MVLAFGSGEGDRFLQRITLPYFNHQIATVPVGEIDIAQEDNEASLRAEI